MLANSNKEIQIKGDKQLIELTTSVEFLTSKLDELEKERKVKDELINSLHIEIYSLEVEVKYLEKKADDQGQYSRKNCLLIHRLNETKTENTNEMILDVISDKLNMEMFQISIDGIHRLVKRKGQKPRAIIVKFTRYKDKNHVFRNKKAFERKQYFCYRKSYSEKGGTPQERERITWFFKCLDTKLEDNV